MDGNVVRNDVCEIEDIEIESFVEITRVSAGLPIRLARSVGKILK